MQEHLEQHLLYLEPYYVSTYKYVCVCVWARACMHMNVTPHTHSVQHKIAKDASLLVCDAASLGEWPPLFQRNVLPPFSWVIWAMKNSFWVNKSQMD